MEGKTSTKRSPVYKKVDDKDDKNNRDDRDQILILACRRCRRRRDYSKAVPRIGLLPPYLPYEPGYDDAYRSILSVCHRLGAKGETFVGTFVSILRERRLAKGL